jgi:Na+/proline symporter
MIARGVFGVRSLPDPEDAFGFACRHVLFPGGVGLLIACVLAANMAGCSAFQVDCGALFTRNFYKKYLFPSRPDRHYLWVGRFSGLVITLLAVVYAVFFIQRVLYSFLLTETLATFVGISVLGGIFWRRANRWGAIASIVVAMGTNFAVYHLRNQRLDHWDPNVFLAAMVAGTITLVVVSLLTPPEPVPALDSFFGRLQTPSDGGEEWKKIDPRTVSEQGRQLLLVNLFHLRRGAAGVPMLKAYRMDLRGFAIGWLIAGAMVGFAWLVFSL